MRLDFWRQHTDERPAQARRDPSRPDASPSESEASLTLTDQPIPEAIADAAGAIAIGNAPAEDEAPPVQAAPHVNRARDRELFQELLNGLYDAILVADPHGIVISSNPRTAALFGYTADDLWDVHCERLMPAMRPAVLAKIRSHVESGRFTMVNAVCTRKDSSQFPAEIAINRINLFNEGDLLFSVRSIERRVRALDRQGLDALVTDSLAAGVLACSVDGRITSANPAFARMVGASSEADVVQHFAGEFFMSQEAGSQALLKTPAGAAHWVGRLALRHTGSHTVNTLATAARTPSRKGVERQIVLTFTPIPARAAVEAAHG